MSKNKSGSTDVKKGTVKQGADDGDEMDFDNPYATDDTHTLNINSQLQRLPDFSRISKISK